MEVLYFICPAVFFLLAITFSFCIDPKVARWINIHIGKIHSEDIRKMTLEQLNYLQKKVRIYFSAAFITVLAISIVFYLFSYTHTSIVSIFACNVICMLSGLFIALSVIKPANELKKKLDCDSKK